MNNPCPCPYLNLMLTFHLALFCSHFTLSKIICNIFSSIVSTHFQYFYKFKFSLVLPSVPVSHPSLGPPHLFASVAGITETIAQLASGWVTDRNLFHKYHYHKAYLILCGLVNLLSPLATSYILLMVYAVFFAIFCGGYMALLLPVLVRRTSYLNNTIHFFSLKSTSVTRSLGL